MDLVKCDKMFFRLMVAVAKHTPERAMTLGIRWANWMARQKLTRSARWALGARR